ncbi:zinc-binding dehydrogenase, partial [Mesorhizobium sp. M1006]|uniref:zinc-binding dehydrogenase n=1 Tax=Mesorhizobium sp. M1006 TaxID=2957048 RepID=UPI0033374B05
ERLGAVAIDYREKTVEQYVAEYTDGRGFDVVYDTGGGTVLDASFASVKRFGHVVSSLGWGSHALAPLSFKAATYSGVFTHPDIIAGTGLLYGEDGTTHPVAPGSVFVLPTPLRHDLENTGTETLRAVAFLAAAMFTQSFDQ